VTLSGTIGRGRPRGPRSAHKLAPWLLAVLVAPTTWVSRLVVAATGTETRGTRTRLIARLAPLRLRRPPARADEWPTYGMSVSRTAGVNGLTSGWRLPDRAPLRPTAFPPSPAVLRRSPV
jgi:hypothetical protein